MPGVACCRDRCLPRPFHCTSYSEWIPKRYKQEPVLVPAQNAHSRNSQPRWYSGLSQQSKKILKKEIRPNRKVMNVWWCGFNPPSPDTVSEKQRDKQRPGRWLSGSMHSPEDLSTNSENLWKRQIQSKSAYNPGTHTTK